MQLLPCLMRLQEGLQRRSVTQGAKEGAARLFVCATRPQLQDERALRATVAEQLFGPFETPAELVEAIVAVQDPRQPLAQFLLGEPLEEPVEQVTKLCQIGFALRAIRLEGPSVGREIRRIAERIDCEPERLGLVGSEFPHLPALVARASRRFRRTGLSSRTDHRFCIVHCAPLLLESPETFDPTHKAGFLRA